MLPLYLRIEFSREKTPPAPAGTFTPAQSRLLCSWSRRGKGRCAFMVRSCSQPEKPPSYRMTRSGQPVSEEEPFKGACRSRCPRHSRWADFATLPTAIVCHWPPAHLRISSHFFPSSLLKRFLFLLFQIKLTFSSCVQNTVQKLNAAPTL